MHGASALLSSRWDRTSLGLGVGVGQGGLACHVSADVHILAIPASSSWPHQLSDHSIVSCSRICPVWAQITWSSQGDKEWMHPQQRQDTLKTASAEMSRPQT